MGIYAINCFVFLSIKFLLNALSKTAIVTKQFNFIHLQRGISKQHMMMAFRANHCVQEIMSMGGLFVLQRTLFLIVITAAFVVAAFSGCGYVGYQPQYIVEAHYQEYPHVAYADYAPSFQDDTYEKTHEDEHENSYYAIYEPVLDNLYAVEPLYEELAAEYVALADFIPYTLDYAIVTRVIDGDTIELECGERVRFIGIDAPEIGEPGADEATLFVREHVYGQTVWLEADGDDRDRFGRLRRYIWLAYPTDPQDEEQIMAYQLNALLLIHGLADVMILGTPRNEALFRRIAQPTNVVRLS